MNSQTLKILVVDDDSFVRDMLESLLESSDHIVETADNGTEALEKIEAGTELDLVISDINMPGINGLELIKRVRSRKMDIPIIILTGNSEITIALKSIKSGANDYILKDENIHDTIFISIKRVIEKYRLKQQNIKLLADLENKNRELERLAFMDGLTGIPNRRYFDNKLPQEWGYAIRSQKPVSVIMIDIDCFKLFNDTYGHQKGDDCLIRVAKTLYGTLKRSPDFVSRYGGEEFVAILPDSTMDFAMGTARLMKKNVEALAIPHETSTASGIVSLSIGVASTVPERDSDPLDLVTKADQALFNAKQEGRDLIKVWE